MPDSVVRLTAADYDEAIRVLDAAFGSDDYPVHFPALLPGWYQHTDQHMGYNYAIRQDGDLAAIVGVFPIQLQIGTTRLSIAGIGGVCTAREHRGKGLMQKLMNHCLTVIEAGGYHLSYLSGQRQRYAYFGYEKAGCVVQHTLTATNIRHTLVDENAGLTFQEAAPGMDLSVLYPMHDRNPVHQLREATDFAAFLHNWQGKLFLAQRTDGEIAGYLVAGKKLEEVLEWGAPDDRTGFAMLQAWLQLSGKDSLRLEAPLYPPDFSWMVGQISEESILKASGNWQVYDWPATLTALLDLKLASTELPEGTIRIALEDRGLTLELKVSAGKGSCSCTAEPPDGRMSSGELLRLLTGPVPPDQVVDLTSELMLLQSWWPLPLYLPRQAHC